MAKLRDFFSSVIGLKTMWLALVLFIILFWYKSFEGYYGYDDIKYCLFAFDVYNGELPSEDSIFSQRIGFYLPISFLYFLFGVNDFSVTLWPLILTLTTLFFIYHILKDKPMHALIAGILFSMNYYTIYFSNKIYPDVALACFSFISLYLLYKRDVFNTSFKGPLIFVVLIGWATLCKECVVYLFPFFLLVLINDVMAKKNYNFWKYTFITGFIFLLLFCFCNYIFFGEILHRSRLIADGHYSIGSYYDKSYAVILKRITYEPIYMFIGSEMAMVIIFAIPSLLQADYKKIYQVDSFINFWSKALLIIILMFWFSSTSYRYYNPMSLQPRMVLLMIPPAAMLAAFGMMNLSLKRALFFSVSFMICGLLQWYCQAPDYLIYILLSAGCLILVFLKSDSYVILAKTAVILVLFIHPLYSIVYNINNAELTIEKPLIDLLIEKKKEIEYKKSVHL